MPAASRQAATARDDWSAADFWQWHGGVLKVECSDTIELSVGTASITIRPTSIEMNAGGASLRLAGGVVRVSADVLTGEISLAQHVHVGVAAGDETSGPPEGEAAKPGDGATGSDSGGASPSPDNGSDDDDPQDHIPDATP